MPVTTPDADPTVATALLLPDHVPPEVASVSETALPVQTDAVPPIAAGGATTVTTVIAVHPEPKE